MKKIKIKLNKKAKNMLIFFSILTIIVISATYAWYISLRQVYITSLDLRIDTNLNLLLSLDGKNWDNVVFIDEKTYNDPKNVYPENTNAWSEVGLIPMSTTGRIDLDASRLVLYQKIGMNTTAGGYRLLANRVSNYGATERLGYIAFDLFIKNFSSKKYTEEVDYLSEEAVYLGKSSIVKVAENGGVPNKGIENSVRVAFAIIGRISRMTDDVNQITSISCNHDGNGNSLIIDGTTGLCDKAIIWEPNDKIHTEGALRWFNSSCLKRFDQNIDLPTSYGSSCPSIKNNEYYPTYAIDHDIGEKDHVDIYDGARYNGYQGSGNFLKETKYFTDSDKVLSGLQRKAIFTLAPNSITKVRIYVYLEGQDIDNYEYAQDGKKISIEFGFTKDRFTEDEIVDGDADVGDDIWKPVITIDPDISEITIKQWDTLNLPVAKAIDKVGEINGEDITEDISSRIRIVNNVNWSIPGEYEVIYEASDWVGNFAEPVVIRVIVEENS